MGKLESVTATLQEREKARLKESKVTNTSFPCVVHVYIILDNHRKVEASLNFLLGSQREPISPKTFVNFPQWTVEVCPLGHSL